MAQAWGDEFSGASKAASSGGGMSIDPVSAIINTVTGIGSAIFQAGEQKKMRQFQEGMSLLSNQQQQEINKQLLQASTATDRMAILNNALAQIQIARLSTGGKNQNTALIAIAIVAVVLIVAVFAIKK